MSFHKFIVTFGFIGKYRVAPGTVASLATVLIFYLSVSLRVFPWYDYTSYDIKFFIIFFFIIIALFTLGLISCAKYLRVTNSKDPREVVIDEVVGQLLTIFLCMPFLFILNEMRNMNIIFLKIGAWPNSLIVPFLFFRLFDIVKPWPINKIENIKGALGVMLDDIMAAIFASFFIYAAMIIIF